MNNLFGSRNWGNGFLWESFMNLLYVYNGKFIYLICLINIYIIDYILLIYESKIGIILKNVYIKNIKGYIYYLNLNI